MNINLPTPDIKSPFKFWCQKVLPLTYDDSLSYYEVLCKLTHYVNGLRDDCLLLNKDVSELNTLYNELKKLVEYYYNTGVQENVNKKLDEMAKNGYFESIIIKYINSKFPLFFDTTIDMLQVNLSVGTKVRTSGYYSKSDGGACEFIITEENTPYSLELNNGLYATVCTINSIITPEIFGAKGDGINDDSSALQKAFDCCFKYPTSNIFKGSRYKNYGVTVPVDIDMSLLPRVDGLIDFNGCTITALSPKMKYVVSYNTKGFFEDTVGFVHHSKTTLTNLTIECNEENAHTGLYIIYGAGAIFSNINVFGCRRGILLVGGVENSIKNCFVRRTATTDLVEKMDKNNDGKQDKEWVDSLKDVFPEKNREEVLVDGKINLIKTQCVGIEMRVTDSFIQDCITVDCVIGIKVTGGDNKIVGCHPWNASCKRQIYSSCCLFLSSSSYVEGLTCDRFYIGVYVNYNQKEYFVNTCFTNQPMSYDTENNYSYCWFISEKDLYHDNTPTGYAYKSMGSSIMAVNTQVYGSRTTNPELIRNLKWCNIVYNGIHHLNTWGYNVQDYIPTLDMRNISETGSTNNIATIKNDTYAKIKCTNSTINLLPVCNNELFAEGETKSGFSNHTVFANNCILNCVKENGESWVTMNGARDTTKSAYMNIGSAGHGDSVPLPLLSGHKYLISLKYKTTNETARIFTGAKDVLYITNEHLECDGEEHVWWNMFECVSGINWAIGTENGENASNISITNIRCYDITNVPRYFLENRGAYFKRVTDFIGVNMTSITTPVRDDISFIATQFPLEFNRDKSISPTRPNYDVLADFYTVRYDKDGKPMVWSHKNTDTSTTPYTRYENVCDVEMGKNMIAYFNAIITDSPECFKFVVKQKNGDTYKNLDVIVGSPNDGVVSANRFDGDIQLAIRAEKRPDNKPVIVKYFEANYDDSCEYPIIDNEGIIPVYHNGGIYLILKGSGEDENYMRELPTVCYTIEY